jgi:hypothetical protein
VTDPSCLAAASGLRSGTCAKPLYDKSGHPLNSSGDSGNGKVIKGNAENALYGHLAGVAGPWLMPIQNLTVSLISSRMILNAG